MSFKVKVAIILVILALCKCFYDKTEPVQSEVGINQREVEVLALNIYHEAQGLRPPADSVDKTEYGWRTVAAVVFNRLEDRRFPKTIEAIVYQQSKSSGKYQFSWVDDNLPNEPKDKKLYREIWGEAYQYLLEYKKGDWEDHTLGAHSYHAITMKPNAYFKKLKPTVVIQTLTQGQIFYKDRT